MILVEEIYEKYQQGLGCRKIAALLPANSYRKKADWNRQKLKTSSKIQSMQAITYGGVRTNHKYSRDKKTVFTKVK
ncbi:recombinase family protein [Anaerobacillus sp. HL2]|nr:recombinase family protein [Anaerobacillus sp. HL2]